MPDKSTTEVRVPNIGDFKDVGVVDLLVKPGDEVTIDQSLLTLESDKATMDVPSPAAGKVQALRVKVGDRVSEGSLILTLAVAEEGAADEGAPAEPRDEAEVGAPPASAQERPPARSAPGAAPAPSAPGAGPPEQTRPQAAFPARHDLTDHGPVDTATAVAQPPADAATRREVPHGSPSVRKLARELGVELARVTGSGPRGRIVQEDVQRFVKQVMAGAAEAPAGVGGLTLMPWPRVDFARFGPVEAKPLSRIRRISAANLSRNWVMIPHVTQFDEADITDLEAFRVRTNEEQGGAGVKVTLLAFVVKACVAALRRYPEFNASLDGESLVLKRYYNIGFAADTPSGLVVPVLKGADGMGVLEIAKGLAELAARAREGKLAPGDMQGGSFSVSSLGGVGGTAFTPIINAPEVAILGVSRAATRPVWDGERFAPRLLLPLSLSYDHRAIDGAAAARFTSYLGQLLGDLRRLAL